MASFDNWYSALDAHDSAYQRAVAEARGPDAAIAQQGFLPSSEIVALGEAAGAAPGTTVLDACCGTGGPAALLAEHLGARLVGVDIAEAGLQQAAARPRLAGRCAAANATRLPFLAAAFDAVVLFDSLVSIPDKAALAREAARVLRPSGRFACTDLFGAPLTPAEQARLPGDTTAHLVPVDTWLATLRTAGLDPLHVRDRSSVATGVAVATGRSHRAPPFGARRRDGRRPGPRPPRHHPLLGRPPRPPPRLPPRYPSRAHVHSGYDGAVATGLDARCPTPASQSPPLGGSNRTLEVAFRIGAESGTSDTRLRSRRQAL
jgi:SAM-dependent methyltransferase